MSDTPSIQELAARLALLEDERAVLRTLYRYGPALDYGHEDDWVDCFTEDGVFDVRSRDGESFVRCEGREQLHAFAAGHTRAPMAFHKHFVADPLITFDGETARVDSYFARVDADGPGGHTYIVAMGRYRDELVRCPDGVWRITLRLAEMQSPLTVNHAEVVE
jgi:SnoaL-like domain